MTVHIPIDTTDEESESDNGQETDKSSVIDEPNTVEKVVNRIPEMNWLFMEAKSFKTGKLVFLMHIFPLLIFGSHTKDLSKSRYILVLYLDLIMSLKHTWTHEL